MRKLVVPLLLILPLALSGCGNIKDLHPQADASLPPKPYGASSKPTAAALLRLPPEAAPERSVELRSESQKREDDPYDLPPKG